MAADSPRPRLVRLALVLAVVAVVVAAVLVVRQVRSEPAAVEPPAATPSAAGDTTTSTGPPSPSASASPSPGATRTAPRSPSPDAPTPTGAASSSGPEEPDEPADDPAPTTEVSTRAPVPLDEPEEVEEGLTARVSRLESVAGEASGPGEVSGPAVRATVTLQNRSDEEVDLSSTVVNLYHGSDETPGSALSGPGAEPLPRSVGAGQRAIGTFVFAVPTEGRSEVLITVDHSVDTPVVAFRGPAPR